MYVIQRNKSDVRHLWKLYKKTAFNNLLVVVKYHIDNDLIIRRENVKATRWFTDDLLGYLRNWAVYFHVYFVYSTLNSHIQLI